MRYIKNFDKFETVNENFDNTNNIIRITNEIENAINKLIENPDQYEKYDTNLLWKRLTQDAKDDNYRGSVVTKYSKSNNDKKFIVYQSKKSLIQTIGRAAADARRS